MARKHCCYVALNGWYVEGYRNVNKADKHCAIESQSCSSDCYHAIITSKLIYTIILLKSVCLSVFANCRSQFLLDRLGKCLYLSVSSDSTSCDEFASQFALAFLYAKNFHTLSRRLSRPHIHVNDPATVVSRPTVMVERRRTADNRDVTNHTCRCPRPVKTATMFIPSRLEECELGIITYPMRL